MRQGVTVFRESEGGRQAGRGREGRDADCPRAARSDWSSLVGTGEGWALTEPGLAHTSPGSQGRGGPDPDQHEGGKEWNDGKGRVEVEGAEYPSGRRGIWRAPGEDR